MSTACEIQDGKLVEYNSSEADIVIPDGVTEIGDKVFQNNKKIVSVVMPDTVVKIGNSAFSKCTKLKSVVFSKNLEAIDPGAFESCSALKTIELPETLRSLGHGVFAGCTKLTSVKCESAVFEAESDPFSEFSATPCVQLADKQGFLIFCGVLYAYYGTATEIIIPDGVRSIFGGVFQSGGLSNVVIPDSVEYIGNNAFANNRTLKTVKLPDDVKLGENVFADCGGLADENGLFIHDGVAWAYYGDGDTVRITAGTRVLSKKLFANGFRCNPGNKNIHTVILPDGLEEIGDSAFADCGLLERITIPESVQTIGSRAFAGCDHLVRVDMPENVLHMGDGVFIGCRGLADEKGFVIANNAIHSFLGEDREIVVPEGITAIAGGVFNKTGITSITLPSTLKKLGSAFTGCNMLTEIEIPEGVTELQRGTFSGCSHLERVSLPSTLIEIDDSVFEGCEKLVEISIPSSVKVIGSRAFRQCSVLPEICIPDGVSIIKFRTFTDCRSLTSIHLPDSVRVIEGSAFENCTSLEEVTIPDAIEEIRYFAFAKCTSLKKVNNRKIHGTISLSAFDGCESLVDENGLTIIADALWKCEDGKENVVIPEGVTLIAPDVFREGWKVRGRGCQFFKSEGTLKSVVLPTTLKKILNGAFAGCKALKQITIPNGVEVIDEECFINCEALARIELPDSVAQIGKRAFSGCSALENARLSASVTELPSELFMDCKALKAIVIPGMVDSLGDDAFRGCGSLSTIEVEEGNAAYSSENGMLYDKSGDSLLVVPGGQKLKEYTIPEAVKTIGRHAFIDCMNLEKIVIPATVENIGDEAFPRNEWNSKSMLKDIEVSPKAGSGTVGENVFDIMERDKPLVYPKLPVTFVKEQTTQVSLGLGYCQNPEKYEGEYTEIYRKYAQSHQKTLIKKAQQQKLKAVERYFSFGSDNLDATAGGGYKPDLTLKKPNELQKVELLEKTVREGTPEDLLAVIQTYQSFEFMARAMGLACRYAGLDMVRVLVESGATFRYAPDAKLQGKYTPCQNTAAGVYRTEYYLMLVPEKLDLTRDAFGYYEYDYTPMTGVSHMGITEELEKKTLPLQERIEIAKYLLNRAEQGVSPDEMLFWALTRGELGFADALMEMGVDLQKMPPSYYTGWGETPTYMETITSGGRSLYWNAYVTSLSLLKADKVLPVLERLHALASAAGKRLIMSQKLYDEMKWSDASLAFALENLDVSKVNQKKAMEGAVSENAVASLAKMAEAGWLAQPAKREGLIEFARKNQKLEALAWLMDFKHRTVDVAAEEAKKEEKALRELTEDPNSVSALKKIWSYKKLQDGTLKITSYKGSDTEVEIPSMIGKAKVSVIGEDAFSAPSWGRTPVNYDIRKKLTSVTIPDGITIIESSAFYGCDLLETVRLPGTLKTIGTKAFCRSGLKTVVLQEGLEKIGSDAFASTPLETVHIPCSVKAIGAQAFYGCSRMRDIFIPAETKKLDRSVLGSYDSDSSYFASKPSGIYVHTPAGSAAEEYMKQYSGVHVVNDYTDEERK